MRRQVALALVAAAVASGVADGAPRPAAAAAPARLLVTATEFRLALSRPRLRPGAALVQLANRGEDGHDLVLRRRTATRGGARLAEVPAGELATLRTALRPGRYVLFCSLPGHRAKGMQAALTVSGR